MVNNEVEIAKVVQLAQKLCRGQCITVSEVEAVNTVVLSL